jgi:hypothetical protein
MSYRKSTRFFTAVITLVMVMTALAAPSQVYAGGSGPGEPPPPHTPSNDLGGPGLGKDTNAPPPPSAKTAAARQITRVKGISAADIYVLDASGTVVPLDSLTTSAALEARFCTVDILGGSETCNPTVATLAAALNQAKKHDYNQIVPEGMLVRLGKGNFGEGISMDLATFFTGREQPYGISFSGQSTAARPSDTLVDYIDIYNSYPTLNYLAINGLATDKNIFLDNIQTYPFGTPVILPSHIDLSNLMAGEGLAVISSDGKLTLKNVTIMPSSMAKAVDSAPPAVPHAGISILAHNGDVSLDHVISNQQWLYGVKIQTIIAASTVPGKALAANNNLTSSIYIQNSQFNNNASNGLEVLSAGDVSLKNVKASNNYRDGASLEAMFQAPLATGLNGSGGNISVQNSNFNNNLETGIRALGNGNINLSDVIANNNQDTGIMVYSPGNINLSEVIANGNSLGIWADSDSGDITLTGITTAGNHGFGIVIFFSGEVTLDHVIASNNEFVGIQIQTPVNEDISGDGAPGGAEGSPSVNLICTITQNNSLNLVIDVGEVIPIEFTSVTYDLNRYRFHFSHEPTIHPPVDCHWPATAPTQKVGVKGEPTGYPIQIIRVYHPEPDRGSGILSHLFSTVFLYVEKQPGNQPDKELGRVSLPVGAAPSGSTAMFEGVSENSLPAPLPEGDVFQGPAFSMTFTSPEGESITGLAGNFMVQFNLPEGFIPPAGKKLAVLWYDESAREWVSLTTYIGGNFTYAYASKPGKFVLVLEPA